MGGLADQSEPRRRNLRPAGRQRLRLTGRNLTVRAGFEPDIANRHRPNFTLLGQRFREHVHAGRVGATADRALLN